jgi:hypothetical protein
MIVHLVCILGVGCIWMRGSAPDSSRGTMQVHDANPIRLKQSAPITKDVGLCVRGAEIDSICRSLSCFIVSKNLCHFAAACFSSKSLVSNRGHAMSWFKGVLVVCCTATLVVAVNGESDVQSMSSIERAVGTC